MQGATQAELARVLGITPRAVRKVQQTHEMFIKTDAGKYDLVQCVPAYIKYKVESETRKTAKGDYDAQRARREEVRIEIDKLKLHRLRGQLHEAWAVEEVWNGMLVAFRSKLLSLPSKWASQLQGMNDPADVMKYLESQINETLGELAEYEPEDYRGMDLDDEDDEDEEDGVDEEICDESSGPKGEKRKATAQDIARKPKAEGNVNGKRMGGAKPRA